MAEVSEEKSSNYKWLILINVSVGTFMATLDGSIANVGLPTISSTLHISLHLVQWVVTAYLLTICAMLPAIGKLSDMFGRGLLYNIGFLIFACGSAMCAVSHSIAMLISMRVVQAIGASCLMANSQGIVATTFAPTERGRALGITGTMVSLGSLAGPSIGGLLISAFGWSSIFWVNVPIGIIGFIAGLYILSKKNTKTAIEPFDYLGSILFVIGIVMFLYTLSNADTWGWSSAETTVGFGIAIVGLISFCIRERFAKFPMIDFSLYRIRAFTTGSIASFLSFISLFCTNVLMPFYLENVLKTSPSTAGCVLAAYPAAMAIVAPFSGWLSDKIGPYVLTTGGLSVNALGFILLNLLSVTVSPWLVAAHLVIFGIGQGMFQSPNNSSVMGAVPRSKVGVVGGLNALTRNVGMIFGTSLSVSLFSYRIHALTGKVESLGQGTTDVNAFMNALHTVFWAAACICIVGAIVSSTRSRTQNKTSLT